MASAFSFDNSYAGLPERFFAMLDPTPVVKPKLIKLNEQLATKLGLNLTELKSSEGLEYFSGNKIPDGSQPLAMVYAGLQFGGWSPQLGDGRALLLGEVLDHDGTRFDIQLKGSGPTPFSRRGDGRAWLGPVLREYIVSEAMHALGVPTTRALAAVSTGETVIREQEVPGAILTRAAKSHVRVGTFQYFAARNDLDGLKTLADYVIDRLHPAVKEMENPYQGLLEAVIDVQTSLVAKWMNLGFIHGVMNTDNVTISGETIDYGPCAFMDHYHPDRVFSSIDEQGRYAFSNQPKITHWNLIQFAQAILPLLAKEEEQAVQIAQQAANEIPTKYMLRYQTAMNKKLGLSTLRDGDTDLTNSLLKIMAEQKADFTLSFRYLSNNEKLFTQQFEEASAISMWLKTWHVRCELEKTTSKQRQATMLTANPAFIPRNHNIEEAIGAALKGDFSPFELLLTVLNKPYQEQQKHSNLMQPPEPGEAVYYTYCGT